MNLLWKFIPAFIRQRLEGRQSAQQILSNIGWLFFDRLLRIGVELVVGVWVARYLGPDQFGLYNYAIAFVALFGTFASLGLNQIVVRDIVYHPELKDELLGTAFALKLIGGGLTVAMTIAAIVLLRPQDSLMHWLVGITATGLIFQAFDIVDLWFQAQIKSKYTVYVRNLSIALIAVIKVILIKINATLIAFVWAGCGELAINTLGFLMIYQVSGSHFSQWRVSLSRARKLLQESWPLIFCGLAITIYMRIDQIMLGDLSGQKAVGLYSAATRISEVGYFIPMVIVSSLAPKLHEARAISYSYYCSELEKLFSLMVALSLVLAVFLTCFSRPLVFYTFGSDYLSASHVLSVHAWASIFVFLGVAQELWGITEKLTLLSLQKSLMGAVINVVLNIVLIPHYSALGAALATVISYATAVFMANALYPQTRALFYLQLHALTFRKLAGTLRRSS